MINKKFKKDWVLEVKNISFVGMFIFSVLLFLSPSVSAQYFATSSRHGAGGAKQNAEIKVLQSENHQRLTENSAQDASITTLLDSLTTTISQVNSNTITVSAFKACADMGSPGAVHIPGHADADGNGCVDASLLGSGSGSQEYKVYINESSAEPSLPSNGSDCGSGFTYLATAKTNTSAGKWLEIGLCGKQGAGGGGGTGTVLPSGAVMAFNLTSCPSGWAPLAGAAGRVIIGSGTLGSDTYSLGDTGGEARHVLTVDEMPSHSHKWFYRTTGPTNAWWLGNGNDNGSLIEGNTAGIGATGGDQPHENRPPYLTLLYCVKD